MTEPPRLRDQSELPSALRDALRELQQQKPAADEVARIEHQLEALPASPRFSNWPAAKGALKLATLGSITALVVTALWSGQRMPKQAGPARHVPVSALQSAVTSPTPAPVDAPAVAPVLAPVERPAAASHGPSRAKRGRSVARARVERSPSGSAAAHDPLRSEGAPGRAAPADSASAQRNVTAPSDVLADIRHEPASHREDEASLLYRAKTMAARQPLAALQLLEAHARDFPNGTFREERFALAIRLQRRIGHEARAVQLEQQFEALYPSSVYRSARAR